MPDETPARRSRHDALLARRDGELAAGARQVGWKIGFNTPAIQQHFGLTDPVVGYLVDTGVTPDGATVPLAGWKAPAVKVKVSIRVGANGEVAALAPALELVALDLPAGSRPSWPATSAARRRLRRGRSRRRPLGHGGVGDPGRRRDGGGEHHCGPATTVSFVRSFLATHGATLEPGQRIIAGSVVAPLSVAAGDELHVAFGPLGNLSIAFAP